MYHSCVHCQRKLRKHPNQLGLTCIQSGCEWEHANVHFEDCSCEACTEKTEVIDQLRSFNDFQAEITKMFNWDNKKMEYHIKAKKPRVASMRYDVRGNHPVGPYINKAPIGMSALMVTVQELIIAGYEITIRSDEIVER